MKKFFVSLIVIILLSGVWGVVRFTALMEGWFLAPWAEQNDSQAFSNRLEMEVDKHHKGNAAYALIEKGVIVNKHFVSVGEPVDDTSVFGVASVGKWVTAIAVMRLVESGALDLDAPVSKYTKRWQLPESEFNNDLVTLRRLLSHTAGIEDGLGHNGFAPDEPIQPLPEHLTLAADADPGTNARVIVTQPPGGSWEYSGGSYNLIQLIIEDVTQQSFQEAMQSLVFEPLGLVNSYFQVKREDPLLAEYFAKDQQTRAYPNYTSLAATGLYTNLSDMHKLLLANLEGPSGQSPSSAFLTRTSLKQIRQPEAYVGGQPIWGAGAMLFAPSETGFIIGHGGKSPYLNATVRFDPQSGDGFIMFQTGNDEAFASNMATQWTLWKTTKPDIYLVNNRMEKVVQDIAVGILLIVSLVIVFWIWRARKQKNNKTKKQPIEPVRQP